MNISELKIDKSWSLFLDRDGVINIRLINDYVKKVKEFQLIAGVAESIAKFNNLFSYILVVTNQQGIGKNLMTKEDLSKIHKFMLQEIMNKGGKIDKIYYAPQKKEDNSKYRKPEIGMALHAKKDFPNINFKQAIMVGDTINDMLFGKRAGMKTVFISTKKNILKEHIKLIDFCYTSLKDFCSALTL